MKLIRELMEMAQAVPTVEDIVAHLTGESNAYGLDFEDNGPSGPMDIAQLHDDPEVQDKLRAGAAFQPTKYELVAYDETCSAKFEMWIENDTVHLDGVAHSDSGDQEQFELKLEVSITDREEVDVIADAVCEQIHEFFVNFLHDNDDDDGDDE